ncbi:HNH endonuclease [Streptomyces sp. NPDC087850]|uniref:HNH endonuclease n=1 Tax=Streptomyces sp. NPDC087850 TaxID=3365809 RepID=UPI00381A2AEF
MVRLRWQTVHVPCHRSSRVRGTHVHHVIHRSQGGSDDKKNLELIHAECHRWHHAAGGRQTQRLEKQP